MNHHVYCVAFLQAAFLPDNVDPQHAKEIMHMLKYIRGPDKAPLNRLVWERMIVQFKKTCGSMDMKRSVTLAAEERLKSYSHVFPQTAIKKIGGVTAAHTLRKTPQVHIDISAMELPGFGMPKPGTLRKKKKRSENTESKKNEVSIDTQDSSASYEDEEDCDEGNKSVRFHDDVSAKSGWSAKSGKSSRSRRSSLSRSSSYKKKKSKGGNKFWARIFRFSRS